MNFCNFNQQRHRADGTQNTATSPMLSRCVSGYGGSSYFLTVRHKDNFLTDKINNSCLTQITIRKGYLDDLHELQQLFVDTITNVCGADYDSKQIIAWTSTVENKKRWQNILTNQFVLVVQEKEKIIGFCTLDNKKHIDFLYVHTDYQRQGIAYRLYADIEKEAKEQGQTELTSDVSKTARLFFEKVGFKVLNEQIVKLKDTELTNYKMEKKL